MNRMKNHIILCININGHDDTNSNSSTAIALTPGSLSGVEPRDLSDRSEPVYSLISFFRAASDQCTSLASTFILPVDCTPVRHRPCAVLGLSHHPLAFCKQGGQDTPPPALAAYSPALALLAATLRRHFLPLATRCVRRLPPSHPHLRTSKQC